jgi:hypothetical protein
MEKPGPAARRGIPPRVEAQPPFQTVKNQDPVPGAVFQQAPKPRASTAWHFGSD